MKMNRSQIMKRSLKIAVIAAVLVFALIGLAIMAAEPVLNSSSFKSRIENAIGELLDMRFRIEGRIKLGFWPLLSVVANNLIVSTSQGEIASAARIEIDPRLTELFSLKLHIDDVHILNPQLTFDPPALDKLSALAARRSGGPLPIESLVIESFSISKASFYYSDDLTVVDIDNMNFDGGRMAIVEKREVIFDDVISFFRTIDFKGQVSARQISSRDFKLTNMYAQVKGENGILAIDPVDMEYLGSGAKLRIALDFAMQKPFLESQIDISGVSIGILAQKFSLNPKIDKLVKSQKTFNRLK